MKGARFVAAARHEFLAEVIYYDNKQPGPGSRFTEAVKEATGRQRLKCVVRDIRTLRSVGAVGG